MPEKYVVTGTLTDTKTVELDTPLPITGSRVRLPVEVLPAPHKRQLMEVMEEIWSGQQARGHRPPTKEEVDRFIQEERASWGE